MPSCLQYPVERSRWNAHDGSACGHVVRDHSIGADGSVIADDDTSEHRRAAPDPHLFADHDGPRIMAGIAHGLPWLPPMIGVADAGVLADHGATSNLHTGHGHDVHARR
jgi:hypothetical protein